MSKPYSPKIDRQVTKRLINQGLYDDIEEAQAQYDERYEQYLEKQERRALRKARKGKQKLKEE